MKIDSTALQKVSSLRKLLNTVKLLKDMPDPKPEVSTSTFQSATTGLIAGMISGDIASIPAGIAGAVTGLKVGERTNSPIKALASSAVVGSLTSTLITLTLLNSAGVPITLPLIASVALISGTKGTLSGLTGTLTGMASRELRDTGNFGLKTSGLVSAVGVNLANAPTVASQIPLIFETTEKERLSLTAGLGFILGALVGAPLGAVGAVVSGVLSSAIALVNSKASGPFERSLRKVETVLANRVRGKFVHKLSNLPKWAKVALAGAMGALGASLTAVFMWTLVGPIGASLVLAGSSIVTALNTYKAIKFKESELKLLNSITESLLRRGEADKQMRELIKLRLKARKLSEEEIEDYMSTISEKEIRVASFGEAIKFLNTQLTDAISSKQDEQAINLLKRIEIIRAIASGISPENAKSRVESVPVEVWKGILQNLRGQIGSKLS